MWPSKHFCTSGQPSAPVTASMGTAGTSHEGVVNWLLDSIPKIRSLKFNCRFALPCAQLSESKQKHRSHHSISKLADTPHLTLRVPAWLNCRSPQLRWFVAIHHVFWSLPGSNFPICRLALIYEAFSISLWRLRYHKWQSRCNTVLAPTITIRNMYGIVQVVDGVLLALSLISLSALLITVTFCKGVQRHPVFVNLVNTCVMFSAWKIFRWVVDSANAELSLQTPSTDV